MQALEGGNLFGHFDCESADETAFRGINRKSDDEQVSRLPMLPDEFGRALRLRGRERELIAPAPAASVAGKSRIVGGADHFFPSEPERGEQSIARIDVVARAVLNPRAAGKGLQKRDEQVGGDRRIGNGGVGRFRHRTENRSTPVPQGTYKRQFYMP